MAGAESMRVSDLYPIGNVLQPTPLNGRDVYIIGTGPSLRVFPIDFLRDRCCILLNKACRILPELGPIGFSNRADFLLPPDECGAKIQIVKGRLKWQSDPPPSRPDNHCSWNDPRFYVFSYRDPQWDSVSHFSRSQLWAEPDYFWNVKKGSVAIFAVQFAALAGARSITLIGCDCCELAGADGADRPYAAEVAGDQTGRVVHNYNQYAAGLDILARECRERFGIPLLHLSPFPGFGREREQFRQFQEWADSGWT
jgi:hypothetical protein